MQWFDVDKQGLAKLLQRKGKAFALLELLQNAWDADATQVDVTLERVPGSVNARLTVEDNSAEGFKELTQAFRLFGQSERAADGQSRGRFCLGEKLVLALASEAEIISTKGSIRFDAEGRHLGRKKRPSGTVFSALIRMTAEEIAECGEVAHQVIPPTGVRTTFNGAVLVAPAALQRIEVTLPTEIADGDGVLRKTTRKTGVVFYAPAAGKPGMLYELGIPVVATGGEFSCDVQQKVPLTFDRDNVAPAYLARIRALAVEHLANSLTVEDANAGWLRDAVQRHGDAMSDQTIITLTELRFGEKRVAYDPSDPEANSLAVSKGYTVVHGAQMSKAEWDVAKRAGAILPAGQVTPSPKPYSPDGNPLRVIPEGKYTPAMSAVVHLAEAMGRRMLGRQVPVMLVNDPQWGFLATYGPSSPLVLNVGRLGKAWFAGPVARIVELLVHEYGHHYAMDHMSEAYHDALCRLGGQTVAMALAEPYLFQLERQTETVAA